MRRLCAVSERGVGGLSTSLIRRSVDSLILALRSGA
jgi:hypothetical protein